MLLSRIHSVCVRSARPFPPSASPSLLATRSLTSMMANLTRKKDAEEVPADAQIDAPPHELVLDRFCLRQFDDPKYMGAQIKYDKAEFEKKINQIYQERNRELVDGYAPFCKHLFVENFTDTRVNVAPITQSNSRLLQTDYEARAEYELPVLVRWFPSHSVTPNMAKYLDIILYSRDQIRKENAATGHQDADATASDAPWGIISIKAQDVPFELPMNPITIMRNALGTEEGGSGVPLSRENYLASVEYWRKHAIILK